jgi:hypothetical protein
MDKRECILQADIPQVIAKIITWSEKLTSKIYNVLVVNARTATVVMVLRVQTVGLLAALVLAMPSLEQTYHQELVIL